MLTKLLNIRIDKIYCINIYNNENRKRRMEDQEDLLGIPISFFQIERNNENPELGCFESHMHCIKNAYDNNYENVLILEDDALFIKERMEAHIKLGGVNIPEDFDIFFLGHNINYGYRYDLNMMKIIACTAAHSYILNKRIYKEIFNSVRDFYALDLYKDVPILGLEKNYDLTKKVFDLFLSKMICQRRLKSYGIYPMISHQNDGYSDIESKQVSYNEIFEKSSLTFSKNYIRNFSVSCLNLERRSDRWEKFSRVSNNFFREINQVLSIDGQTYDFNKYKSLFDISKPKFKNNHYPSHMNKKGVLGCSLTHYLMWKTISDMDKSHIHLILEDDIMYKSNFIRIINEVLYDFRNTDWDIIYLGYTDYEEIKTDEDNGKYIKLSGEKRYHGGGSFAYLINPKGAKILYDLANSKNIQQAIDWFMIDNYDSINAYKLKEDIIFSNVYKTDKDDTDVQNTGIFNFSMELQRKQITAKLINGEIISSNGKIGINSSGRFVLNENIKFYPSLILDTQISYKVVYIGSEFNLYLFNLFRNINNVLFFTETDCDFIFEDIHIISYEKFSNLYPQLKISELYFADLRPIISTQLKHKFDFIYSNKLYKFNYGRHELNLKIVLSNHRHLINNIIFPSEDYRKYFELVNGRYDDKIIFYKPTKINIKNNLVLSLDKYNFKFSLSEYKNHKDLPIIFYSKRINPTNKTIIKEDNMFSKLYDSQTSHIILCSEMNINNPFLLLEAIENNNQVYSNLNY